MRLAQTVRVGAWFLIGLNLLMALGSIWIFKRMAPAIEVIIQQNQRSLQAGEDMLASLALVGDTMAENDAHCSAFKAALDRAKNNVTEAEEPKVLAQIEQIYVAACHGDLAARQQVVPSIIHFGNINRQAMLQADRRAQQLGYAGAWGVVFMAVCVFLAGIIFIRRLSRRVVTPLEEIYKVVAAYQNGDTMRRCVGSDLPPDVRGVYSSINDILDLCQGQSFLTKD